MTKQVKPLEYANEDIQLEMVRSRHGHHPLGIVVVAPEADSIKTTMHYMVQEVQQNMMHSYVVNNMAHTLSKYLRRTDLILEQRQQGRFIVLCPDTQANDLTLLVEYIQSITQEQLGITVTCGTASFPMEALTFDELVHHAELRLKAKQ